METNQIYGLINSLAQQSMGESAITVTDTASLVSLGNAVLSSNTNTDAFTNVLVQRIARTIVSYRAYRNQLGNLAKSNIEWGAIVQKLKVAMPKATEDETYNLVDGQSVDMFKVSKPKTKQKFFVKRTPYNFFVTFQRVTMREAFTSADAFGAWVSAVYGEVQNKLEHSSEDEGRAALANMAGQVYNAAKPAQVVKLITLYKAETGKTVTRANYKNDPDFMRFCMRRWKEDSKNMRSMSTSYNVEGEERHSPEELQKFACLNSFMVAMETNVYYSAFHDEYLKKVVNLEIPYWQAEQTRDAISVKIEDGTAESGKKEVHIDGLVAMMFDTDAVGTYKEETETLNTPINAAARYWNTYWHAEKLWFNDLSENCIIYTLE